MHLIQQQARFSWETTIHLSRGEFLRASNRGSPLQNSKIKSKGEILHGVYPELVKGKCGLLNCFHPGSAYAKLSTRGWKLAGVVLLMGTASVFWEINQHVAGYSL